MSEEKKEEVVVDESAERALLDKLMKKYNVSPAGNTVNVTLPDTSIDLVYMSDSDGYIKTHNIELTIGPNKVGQHFALTRAQADEVIGACSSWFDKGILAIAAKDADYAAVKGVRVDSEFKIDPKRLARLGSMSVKEIDDFWMDKSLTSAQRLAIITYYKRNFIAGTQGYRDVTRVGELNRLTDGGFKAEMGELTDDDFKYQPSNVHFDKREELDSSKLLRKDVDKDYRSDKI